MEFTVVKPTRIDVEAVRICVPLRYDDEDSMPQDFPLRKGGTWDVIVDIATGRIRGWPVDKAGDFSVHEKVVDCGSYWLLGKDDSILAEAHECYVPNCLVPGEYGDYVILEIKNGVITNWPTAPDVSEFFDR